MVKEKRYHYSIFFEQVMGVNFRMKDSVRIISGNWHGCVSLAGRTGVVVGKREAMGGGEDVLVVQLYEATNMMVWFAMKDLRSHYKDCRTVKVLSKGPFEGMTGFIISASRGGVGILCRVVLSEAVDICTAVPASKLELEGGAVLEELEDEEDLGIDCLSQYIV